MWQLIHDNQADVVRVENATPDLSTEEEDTSSSEVDGPGVANRKRGHGGGDNGVGPSKVAKKEAVSVTPHVSNA